MVQPFVSRFSKESHGAPSDVGQQAIRPIA
jgi:hypothetical protein